MSSIKNNTKNIYDSSEGEQYVLKNINPGEDIFALIDRRISRIFSKRLVNVKAITPNRLSVVALFVGFIAALFFSLSDSTSDTYIFALLAVFVAHLSFIVDQMDGDIARSRNQTSKFGRWIDNIGDLLTTKLYILAIAFGTTRWLDFDVTETRWIIASISIMCAALLDYSALLTYYLKFNYDDPESNKRMSASGLGIWLLTVAALLNQLFTFIIIFTIITAIEVILLFFIQFKNLKESSN